MFTDLRVWLRRSVSCAGSGVVLGGYKEEHETKTVRIQCTDCWRRVDVEPITPETRTDLRVDGAPVQVNRKQIVLHERGSSLGTQTQTKSVKTAPDPRSRQIGHGRLEDRRWCQSWQWWQSCEDG